VTDEDVGDGEDVGDDVPAVGEDFGDPVGDAVPVGFRPEYGDVPPDGPVVAPVFGGADRGAGACRPESVVAVDVAGTVLVSVPGDSLPPPAVRATATAVAARSRSTATASTTGIRLRPVTRSRPPTAGGAAVGG
jgi:hypothetical protein